MTFVVRSAVLAAVVVATAALPGAAPAATITGSYSLSSPGLSQQTGDFSTPASAAWSFSFRAGGQQDGSGSPATLTTAHQDPYSKPCGDDPSTGATTTSVDGVTDSDARVSVIPYFNVRAGRGKAVVFAEQGQPGSAQMSIDRQCAPPLDSDNGVTTTSVSVSQMFSNVPNEGDFALVRQRDGSWTAKGSKRI